MAKKRPPPLILKMLAYLYFIGLWLAMCGAFAVGFLGYDMSKPARALAIVMTLICMTWPLQLRYIDRRWPRGTKDREWVSMAWAAFAACYSAFLIFSEADANPITWGLMLLWPIVVGVLTHTFGVFPGEPVEVSNAHGTAHFATRREIAALEDFEIVG